MSRQLKTYFTNRNNTSLLEYILLGILLVSFIAFGLVKNLNMDEREHLQATWLIYAGDVPYRDFFEHHHPGMWYLFSLLLSVCDNSAYIWYVLRVLMIACTLVSAWFLRRIVLLIGGGSIAATFCLVWWFCTDIVWHGGVEYRPDNPMIMFFIIGLFYFLRYLKEPKLLWLYVASVMMFFSFWMLQKIFILLVPIVGFVIYLCWRQKINLNHLCFCAAQIVVLCLGILFLLVESGTWHSYFILNWLLNRDLNAKIFYGIPLAIYYLQNIFVLALSWWLWKRNNNSLLRFLVVMFGISMVSVLFIFPLWLQMPLGRHYFLLVYPYAAILFGMWFEKFVITWKYRRFWLLLLSGISALVGVAMFGLTIREEFNLQAQIRLDDIILGITEKDDLVVCNIELTTVGGLRRCASGYYFFSLGNLAPVYHYFYGGPELPRLNELIRARKPKVVTNSGWHDCKPDSQNKIVCGHQEIDTAWMEDYYYNNGFIYTRAY